MHLVLVGLSHHTAPIEVRERLSVPEQLLPRALAAAAARPGVCEAAILSTCNRTEVYAVADSATQQQAHELVRRHLADFHQIEPVRFLPHLYCKAEHEVPEHLVRVAAGLDSLVLGEPQILGQVRTALRYAQAAGSAGGILTALFQQAITGGKRAHTETGLSRGSFSIGHAAVDLAASIFDDLSRSSVLILGAGKMSELTARHLVSSGVRFVMVANRTYSRAQNLARQLGGRAIHYEAFSEALVTADIVISSTAAPHPVMNRELLAPILRRRRGKPLFLIDIAVPRDIAPDVYGLPNVFLYNTDDLQEVVATEAQERAVEAVKAEVIVADEAARFLAWYRTREVAPVITQLREQLEQIRQQDLAILRGRLGTLSDREWQAIESSTRAMMNRVARSPILRLKRETEGTPAERDGAFYDLPTAARELFGLLETPDASGSAPEDAGSVAPTSPSREPEREAGTEYTAACSPETAG